VLLAIVSDKNDCKNVLARYHLRLAGERLKAAKDPNYYRPGAGPEDEPPITSSATRLAVFTDDKSPG
jgi:hypothetical protein